MAESDGTGAAKPKRISKLQRQPEAVADKKLTARSFEIIAAIADYRFLPSSLLVRLVGGNEDVTHRHLQLLFHKGLVNRFAFPKTGGSNEFNYYLDNPKALLLLVQHGLCEKEELDFEGVQRNKEKDYCRITEGDESAGRALFLRHELMISRFHFMLQMGCNNSEGKVELLVWKQGPQLHDSVVDSETGELLPYRPDAFFTLRFPNDPEGQNKSNFFYEADRKTTSIPKMLVKFRAYVEFVRQRKHQTNYGIKRIRAVLVETLDTKWAEELRQAATEICQLSLFWFTASAILTAERSAASANEVRNAPLFLEQPDIVLQKVWVPSSTDTLCALPD